MMRQGKRPPYPEFSPDPKVRTAFTMLRHWADSIGFRLSGRHGLSRLIVQHGLDTVLKARRRFIAKAKAREASGVPLDDPASYFRGVLRELHAQRQLEARLAALSDEDRKAILSRAEVYTRELVDTVAPGADLTPAAMRAPILRAAREYLK